MRTYRHRALVLGAFLAAAVIGAAPAALADGPETSPQVGSSASMTISVTIVAPEPGTTPPPAVPATTPLIPFQPAEPPAPPASESQGSSLPSSPGAIAAIAMVGVGALGGAVRLAGHVVQMGWSGR